MAHVRIVSFGSPQHASTLALRGLVMRCPDQPALTDEEVESEREYVHLGLFEDDALVACLMLSPLPHGLAQLRQVSVHPERRRLGLGRQIVAAAEDHARRAEVVALAFYARDEAVAFWEAMGYVHEATWFAEVGVPEQMMAKRLRVP